MAETNNIKYLHDGEQNIVYPKTIVGAIEDFEDNVKNVVSNVSELVTKEMLTTTLNGYVTTNSYIDTVNNLSSRIDNCVIIATATDSSDYEKSFSYL